MKSLRTLLHILLFSVLMAVDANGQAYRFETSLEKTDFLTCRSQLEGTVSSSGGTLHLVAMGLSGGKNYEFSYYFRVMALGSENKAAVQLCNQVALSDLAKRGARHACERDAVITFDNGLKLTAGCTLYDARKENLHSSTEVGVLDLYFYNWQAKACSSSTFPGAALFRRDGYVSRLLSLSNILSISVGGIAIDMQGVRSAATFCAMFNTIRTKVGWDYYFFYDGPLYPGDTTPAPRDKASASGAAEAPMPVTIDKVWVTHNEVVNGYRGLKVWASCRISDLSKTYHLAARFKAYTGIYRRDNNGIYTDDKGRVMTRGSFKPKSNDETLSVFIPYSELHLMKMKSITYNEIAEVEVQQNGTPVSRPQSATFQITGEQL